jgi:hypothetical protein
MITENHAENGACKSPRSSKATNCERTAAKAADDTGILLRAQPRSVSTVGIPTPVQLYESTYWPYACPAVGGPYSYSCTPLLASTISQDSRRISDLSVSVQQPAGRLWSPDSWAHSSTAVVEMQGAGRRAQGAGRRAQGAGRRAHMRPALHLQGAYATHGRTQLGWSLLHFCSISAPEPLSILRHLRIVSVRPCEGTFSTQHGRNFAGVTIPVEFSHGLPRQIIRGHPSSYRTFILVLQL